MPLIPRIVCCLRSKCYSDECLPSKVIVDCSTGYATTSSTAYSRVNAQHIKDRNQIRSHFSRRACKPNSSLRQEWSASRKGDSASYFSPQGTGIDSGVFFGSPFA